MIAEPPVAPGALHDTTTSPSPATPDGAPGAPGGTGGAEPATGVTAADAAEAVPEPATFAAATVNVYAVPFDKPVTVHVVAGGEPDVEHCRPPGDAVTV